MKISFIVVCYFGMMFSMIKVDILLYMNILFHMKDD